MPQAQVKNFPGFGIVYPGGGERGIKIVKTFTQAPKKVFHADGSVSYEPPPPTIHELFGGGFCYAGGNPVTDREHLENISDLVMRQKALEWYDKHGRAISPEDVVIREEVGEKERPEPAYILSNQLPKESDEVTKDMNHKVEKEDGNLAIAKVLSELVALVKKQGKEIDELKKGPPIPPIKLGRKAQSEKMKAKWADPEYKAKMVQKIHGKKEIQETKTE